MWLGLDYAAAQIVLARLGGDRRRARRRVGRIFEDLRVMEAAALEAFNEVRE